MLGDPVSRYNPCVVADASTILLSWAQFTQLVPNSLDATGGFKSRYLFAASGSRQLVRFGLSGKPLDYIRTMEGPTASTITEALIGVRVVGIRLRMITPVPWHTINRVTPFLEETFKSRGHCWYSGTRVHAFLQQAEALGRPYPYAV